MLVRGHSEVSLVAQGDYEAVLTPTDKHKNEYICFKTPFCFVNISAPLNCTEMVLYSKFAYGSQFSGEKNYLKILQLVYEILGKNPVSFFLGRPVYVKIF